MNLANDGQRLSALAVELFEHLRNAGLRRTGQQILVAECLPEIGPVARGNDLPGVRENELHAEITVGVGTLRPQENSFEGFLNIATLGRGVMEQLFRNRPVFGDGQQVAAPLEKRCVQCGTLVVSNDFFDACCLCQFLVAGARHAHGGQTVEPERKQGHHGNGEKRGEIDCNALGK